MAMVGDWREGTMRRGRLAAAHRIYARTYDPILSALLAEADADVTDTGSEVRGYLEGSGPVFLVGHLWFTTDGREVLDDR